MLLPKIERISRDIMKIAEFTSSEEPGYTRISFSKEDLKAREYIRDLMEKEANLSVRVDAAGNIIGRREGKKQGPCILMGSHIDTVRGGGRFDGVAGVVAGLEIARRFEEMQIEIFHPIEVVVFVAEEPSPFGISTVGSRALAGILTEDLLDSLKDSKGRTLRKAITEIGGDPSKLIKAKRSPDEILANLELHIEQGPILFSRGIHIGVVTGIAGIRRGKIEVIGEMAHPGTTPMTERKDALAAASEVILAIEEICRKVEDVVGTFGRIEVFPNSLNVVPGAVRVGVDLRSLKNSNARKALSLFQEVLERIQVTRGVLIRSDITISSHPVILDKKMVKRISKVCQKLKIPYLEMPSGAGHDASHIAELAPTGMIFVPSKNGKSHCPEEWTDFEDICQGIEVMAGAIATLDKEEMI